MTILLTKAVRVGGSVLAAGTTQTLDAAVEGQLVHNGSATYVSDPATALNDMPVKVWKTPTGGLAYTKNMEDITSQMGGNTLPPLSYVTVEGDSLSAEVLGESWLYYLSEVTDGYYSFNVGYNCAVSGETAAQVAAPSEVAAVNATQPRVVTLLVGSNSLDQQPGAVIADIKQSVDGYLRGGADYVVLVKVLPRTDLNGTTTPRWTAVNEGIGRMASGRIKVVSVEDFNAATDTTDGVHLTWGGARKVVDAIGSALNGFRSSPTAYNEIYLSDQNIYKAASANYLLAGTSGSKGGSNNTGNVADGWQVYNSSACTVVNSKVVEDGVEKQVITITGTASALDSVRFSRTPNHSVAIGDKYEGAFTLEIAAGQTGLVGMYQRVIGYAQSPGFSSAEDKTGFNGVFKTACTAAAPSTASTIQHMIDFNLAGATNLVIKVLKPTLIKLDNAANVIAPVMATTNLTGGFTFTQAEFDAITPVEGQFYFVEEV